MCEHLCVCARVCVYLFSFTLLNNLSLTLANDLDASQLALFCMYYTAAILFDSTFKCVCVCV